MELGAKIGVKIRERDEGGGNKAKVQWIIIALQVLLKSHDLHIVGLCDPTKAVDFGSLQDERF